MKKIVLKPNCELHPLQLTDVPDIFHVIDSQRKYLRTWLPFVDHTKSTEDTARFVRAAVCDAEQLKEYVFTIQYEGKFVGIIGLKDTDSVNMKTEVGYWLSQEAQGKGLMTEAVDKLCLFLFKELKMNRVQIKCAVNNVRSNQIPLRLGFQLEGVERDGELLSSGKYADLNIYSKLKSEIKVKRKK